jgi:hypothetical protein
VINKSTNTKQPKQALHPPCDKCGLHKYTSKTGSNTGKTQGCSYFKYLKIIIKRNIGLKVLWLHFFPKHTKLAKTKFNNNKSYKNMT